jgi:quinol monooxygenase YgiN
MIHATVTIVSPPGQHQGFMQALRSVVGPTRVEPGCLFCHLYEDVEVPGSFTLVEDWVSPVDFERRLRSEAYRQLLLLMELSPEAPVIQFHRVDSTAGMEAILAARSGRPTGGAAAGPFRPANEAKPPNN